MKSLNRKIFEIKNRIESIKNEIISEIQRNSKYINTRYNLIIQLDTYLIYTTKFDILNTCDRFLKELNFLKSYNNYFDSELSTDIQDSIRYVEDIKEKINSYNPEFVKRRKKEYSDLFKIGKHPLDESQQNAIIIDDKHNLVVAGAGAGKTAVLTTRIAYLIKRKPDSIKPERILALAFQSNASEEMKGRLKQKYGLEVVIRTFHSLGYQILKDTGKNPNLLGNENHDKKVRSQIKKLWENALQDTRFQNEVINYMKLIGNEDKIKKEAEFKTKESFYKYQKELELKTLNDTTVKSIGEQEIMNFFLTHKINGEDINIFYEQEAEGMEYCDESGDLKPVHPDFFLKDYDVYIEHWAINDDNTSWFGEEYIKNMELKKQKFDEEKKALVSTTYAEFKNNPDFIKILKRKTLEVLKNKYPDENFEFTRIDYKELVEKVWDDCKTYVEKLPQNIQRFISIAKTYNFTPEEIQKRLTKEKWTILQKTFGIIALRIYSDYQKEMKNIKKIDFHDMINDAIHVLQKNKDLYKDKLDHILIDEYQDISKQRYLLIKTLMDRNPNCKLFCVGDDWQSIMSFSGSHLKYFVDFEKYFHHPARTDLQTNYRSIKSVVDTGSELIQKNKGLQLDKTIKAKNRKEKPIRIFSLKHKPEKRYRRNYLRQIIEHCLDEIEEYTKKHNCKPEDIMILTRIIKNPLFTDMLMEQRAQRNIPIAFKKDEVKPSKNKIYYMSVHQSKGLESKVVFILDVVKGTYGFPCELEDPTIFNIARDDVTENKLAEERRLFYVALTRAKEDVVIYTQREIESQFLKEINRYTSLKELSYSVYRKDLDFENQVEYSEKQDDIKRSSKSNEIISIETSKRIKRAYRQRDKKKREDYKKDGDTS